MPFWYPLLRPFAYLWIEGADKRSFDLWLPAVAALVATSCAAWARPQLYMPNGVFAQVGSMVQNLPGFYIAALAAVATFQRNSLDTLLPAPTPTINTFINGTWMPIQLTRRRLLTLLFSYLSALSFAVYLSITFANAFAPTISGATVEWFRPFVSAFGATVLFFLIAHMLSVTLFGLYQIGERIFQAD